MNSQLFVGLEQYIDEQIQEIRVLESKNELTVGRILDYSNIIIAICRIVQIEIPTAIKSILYGTCTLDEHVTTELCTALTDLSYEIDKIGESYA